MSVDFARQAHNILVIPESPEAERRLARRYLALNQRKRVLKRGLIWAHRHARRNNPLNQIGFKPPLSVAGCDSGVIVRAEGLALRGVPIAFERDGKGQHRGMPLGNVIDRLKNAGLSLSDQAVLRLYGDFMAAAPGRLRDHSIRRFARIPTLMDRLELQRRYVEQQMTAELIQDGLGPPRFALSIDLADLCKAATAGRVCTIGCDGSGSCAINGRKIRPNWSRGSGCVIVYRANLNYLIEKARPKVGMEFGLTEWIGWCGESESPDGGGWSFSYAVEA